LETSCEQVCNFFRLPTSYQPDRSITTCRNRPCSTGWQLVRQMECRKQPGLRQVGTFFTILIALLVTYLNFGPMTDIIFNRYSSGNVLNVRNLCLFRMYSLTHVLCFCFLFLASAITLALTVHATTISSFSAILTQKGQSRLRSD